MRPGADVAAVIVAGGSGTRMGAGIRKQYLLLAGRPILAHTVDRFLSAPEVDLVIVVVPEPDIPHCRAGILGEFRDRIRLVPGGGERQDSVLAGLRALPDGTGVVLIHDGVRPFVSHREIAAAVAGAREWGACLLAVPAADTLKRVAGETVTETVPREGIWLAQTPQAFQRDLILSAHESARREGILGTDDASLVERTGHPVRVIPGSRWNLKITTPEDLKVGEALARSGLLG